ncbi:PEP-CTERM sorting domain-containing protein [Phycisphaera mikurensis]|uniref:PEP-CTERM protein-sorting domain-containing protein n=1 Tax=Phycisphaera mikurensis (strain NBRC 102666 / KCTC 22515 / FYK2301M01) TaxID=1142394 RepID=I0IC78_PHYMF|nr:PEP-CTERM sorting domain-containing protein [Phycisphaera mikurensis]MBB6441915.1 hypothetical protein [Phycisphaera mikurensis]BAM02866.1 hypothetical protein PSMK_07070 [Phycisphaera mikurensis NBRC 102666]
MQHTIAPTLLLAAALAPAAAHAEHADAMLLVGPDGRLTTGLYSFDTATVLATDERVFEGEFDAFGIVAEPGFNALPAGSAGLPAGFSALPGNTPVTFTGRAFTQAGVTSNLWHWDATGPVDFQPVTAPTSLDIKRSVFTTNLDGGSADAAGFLIDTTGASGSLHRHVSFQVNDGDGDPLVQSAAAGFYLWSMELAVGSALTAEPIFFVHGLGVENEALHEQAIAFVEANVVPEPTAALGLAAAGVVLLSRRRAAA